MTENGNGQMAEWLTKFIYEYANGNVEFYSKGLAMLRAILAALEEKKRPKWDMEKSVDQILHSKAALATPEPVTAGETCDCDNYKWLTEELIREASFLYVHGLIIENRGPFKFCPYCGKYVVKDSLTTGKAHE